MKKIILSAAVLLTAGIALSQKVTNQLNFPKGAKIEVSTTIESVASVMGDMTTKAIATRMLDVEDVKDGIATIESKLKRLQFTFEGMGQSQSFDSENEADMKGEIGKEAEKALKNKYSMKVDAKGNITAVTPDDDNPNKERKKEGEDADNNLGMLAGVMDGMDLPKPGDKIEFAILPDRSLSKGDSWTDTASLMKGLQRSAKYTITDITEETIVVEFAEESKGRITRENMGMEIVIDQEEKTTGKIIINKQTGLVKQKTSTKSTEGTMEVMGQTMPLSTKTIIKEVVTIK